MILDSLHEPSSVVLSRNDVPLLSIVESVDDNVAVDKDGEAQTVSLIPSRLKSVSWWVISL